MPASGLAHRENLQRLRRSFLGNQTTGRATVMQGIVYGPHLQATKKRQASWPRLQFGAAAYTAEIL